MPLCILACLKRLAQVGKPISTSRRPPIRSTIYACKSSGYHTPVLLSETCDHMMIRPGQVFVDCTLGGGGHAKEILRRGGLVIGIDQDGDAIENAKTLLADHISSGNLEIYQDNFRNVKSIVNISKLAAVNGGMVHGVIMDLGVSSHQIDEPSRGFAFRFEGPLDMRMDYTSSSPSSSSSSSSLTAYDIVNNWTLTDIANTLYRYGEEHMSRQIAREIVASRPLRTTKDLADAIGRVISSHVQRQKALARCFQALRIVVNGEMESLRELLTSLDSIVLKNGRVVALSYHSLEDRLVKKLIKHGHLDDSNDEVGKVTRSSNTISKDKLTWKMIFKQMEVSSEELKSNKRSRSAKLRVAERL